MSLTAIVPVWNGRDVLARLLATLEAQTQPATKLLVVDNGSTDGAPELAREHGAHVISMGRNAGFAAAVNRGIRECRSEWIAILNSDVELAPDYFARLLAAGAPFATGKILSAAANGRIDATFDAVCRAGVAWRVGHGRADAPEFCVSRKINSAPWTAVVCRADLFRRVGLLQEDFESYLEDVEFGIRCASSGIGGLYVPEALAWHQGSATLGRWHPETVRRLSRNQCFLVALHYPPALLRRCAWPILVGQLMWGAVAARHGTAWAWLRGKWEGLWRSRTLRRSADFVSAKLLDDWLRDNESNIYHIQQLTGFDPYWRLYFLLTSGGAK
jgi:GT2 family glycosyltransferase